MTKAQAHAYLEEAELLNPGPWAGHSRQVALAAEDIAEQAGLDPILAYTMGLLHDIGRRCGVHGLRHSIDGYNFLISQGYPRHARICITHSFTTVDLEAVAHVDDLTPEERTFVMEYVTGLNYDDYDCLIQLCDFYGLPDRRCTFDERYADVISRTPNPTTKFIESLEAKRPLEAYFAQKIQEYSARSSKQ